MDAGREAILDDVAALKEALAVERAKALEIAAELAIARAKASEDAALIAQQKLRIAKLERQIYGQRSERSSRLIEQLVLTFEELEAAATEDELAAERAVAKTTTVRGFTRKRGERQTFPEHLPRERVVIDPPTACECCGSNRLRKLGEDVTRTLEVIPRQWKVIETVREKFSCRDCEKISQAPAPFHAIARGWAGPSREQVAKLSRGHDLAKAFNYILKRWASFTLFLEDGRVCLSNNAAERGLRGIALGRKSWLFCGSDRGGRRAAAMYSLIVTAKMNGVNPQAWLADVLARIAAHPAHRLHELLPWNWKPPASATSARAA
jgi:Transposase IS66 family/IS66 C-terminal element/zinc-finger binding domain of transposase IS66/Transposase C of IS166 homeodomain